MGTKTTQTAFQGRLITKIGEITNPTVSSTVREAQFVKTRTGFANPKWRQMVRSGQDATTQFDASDQAFVLRPFQGSWSVYYSGTPTPTNPLGTQFQSIAGIWDMPLPLNLNASYDITTADNLALMRLIKDIQSQTSRWQGGVFLGEIREAISMIKHPARGLRKGLSDYLLRLKKVSKGIKRLPGLLKVISDTWLEYTFGWRPFINDIKSAASILGNYSDFNRGHARGYAYADKLMLDATDSVNLMPNLYVYRHRQWHSRVQCIYRAGLDFKAHAPIGSWRRLAELAGFSWEQFVPTIWELIPFSFVSDYFVNIGDILTAASFNQRDVIWTNRTYVFSESWLYQNTPDYASSIASLGSSFLRFEGTGDLGYTLSFLKNVQRRSVGIGIPSLQFHLPPVDSIAWINLSALIGQSKDTSRFLFRFL